MSDIFLSHSSQDDELAAEIKRWLHEQELRSVFLDFDPGAGIPPGRSWERELYQQLRSCRAVLALCTESFAASRWCFAEITQARSLGKQIIPLRSDGCAVDPVLQDLQIVDLGKGREDAFERLKWALAAAGVDAAEYFDWSSARSPYPGLLSFEEEDAAVFFGREAEIGAGLDTLNHARWQGGGGLVLVLGASGSGKSSLLRAGLIPRLRRDPQRWLIVGPFKPGAEPLRELAGCLAEAYRAAGVPRDWNRLRDDLAAWAAGGGGAEAGGGAGTTNPLAETADDLRLRSARREARVLLVIDQFEELLAHGAGHPSDGFLALVRDAAERPGGPLLVLGTLRSDYLGELQRHPRLRGVGLTHLSLGPMLDEGLLRVIEEPARRAGIDIGPGLAAAMLHDAEGGGALPLVAFTLRELYSRFAREGELTLEHYRERLGGLDGAVARVAESVLPAGPQLAAIERDLRDAFLRLVRFDDNDRPARDPVAWTRMPEAVRPVLLRFVEARLLTMRGEEGESTIEVAHEALFSAWGQLANWIEESREALVVRRELRHGAGVWVDGGRREEDLWRGGRLVRAAELRRESRLPLGERAGEFLDASEAADRHRREVRRRTLRLTFLAVSLAAVVMLVLAVAAYLGRNEARRERLEAEIQGAKALAIQSRYPGYQLDRALLLAVESGRTLAEVGTPADPYPARTSVLQHLLASPGFETFLHAHDQGVGALAFSPDGHRLASGGADGRLVLWDVESRRALVELDHCTLKPLPPLGAAPDCGERVKTLAFSPDGGRLAAGTEHGKLVVWSTATDEPERVLQEHGTVVLTLAFAPGGELLATGDLAGSVRLWPLAEGAPEPPLLAGHDGVVSRVAFTADGSAVISGGRDRTVRRWSVADGAGSVLHRFADKVYDLALGAGGEMAVGFDDGTLQLWSAPGGALRFETVAHQGEIREIAFGPDGRLVATAGFDGAVALWDAAGGQPRARLPGHAGGAESVAFAAAGHRLATGAGDGKVRLWHADRIEPPSVRTANGARLVSVAFGAGGLAASGGLDGSVELTRMRPAAGAHQPPTVPPLGEEVWGLALGPRGRTLAASSGALGVRVWDLGGARATERYRFDGQTTWIWSAAIDAAGRLLATSDEGGSIRVWDLETGVAALRLPPRGSALAVAFGPDPQEPLLAVGRKDGRVEVWDGATGQLLHELRGHRNQVNAVAFAPDGTRLASASLDGTLRVWLLAGDDPPLVLDALGAGIRSVAFSADGAWIASGDLHGEIRIWDATSGDPRVGMAGHRGQVLGLEFDGAEWLLSGGEDRTLRRWRIGLVATDREAWERACRMANRNLDREEWQEFLRDRPYRETCPMLAAAAPESPVPGGTGAAPQRTGS